MNWYCFCRRWSGRGGRCDKLAMNGLFADGRSIRRMPWRIFISPRCAVLQSI
jgi:hypothetical protein